VNTIKTSVKVNKIVRYCIIKVICLFLVKLITIMKKSFFLLLAVLTICFPSCTEKSFGAYSHVVVIGVDGAGAFFSETSTPRTYEIFKDAATSYDVVTSFPTISGQCWGSMLHGVLADVHGLTNKIVSSTPYPTDSQYPSFFRVAREAHPEAKLASFCNWNPINFGIVEDNLDVVKGTGKDSTVTSQVLSYLEDNDPEILFIQFDSVDGAGHGYGYGTEGHLAALTAVDGMIGQIYEAFEKKGILENTLFIVTSDHGGTPEGGHGGDTPAERIVFLGACGKTITGASTIQNAEVQDIPAIVSYALGIEAPSTWTGTVPTGLFPEVTAAE